MKRAVVVERRKACRSVAAKIPALLWPSDLARLPLFQPDWPLVSSSPQVVRVPWQGVPGAAGGASQAPAGGGASGTAGQISASQAAGAQRFAPSHQQRQPAET